nr:unnamed protein product [Callosobruchus analis]CAI5827112.1 unnamed protein product [Callosobruchus analis]
MSLSDIDTLLNFVEPKIAKKDTPHFENQSPFQKG